MYQGKISGPQEDCSISIDFRSDGDWGGEQGMSGDYDLSVGPSGHYGGIDIWGYHSSYQVVPGCFPYAAEPVPENLTKGDPIQVIKGNVVHQETDIWIPAPGMGLSLKRFYDSTPGIAGGELGPQWRHTYDWSVFRYRKDFKSNDNPPEITSLWVARIRHADGHPYELHYEGGSNWWGVGEGEARWYGYGDVANSDFRLDTGSGADYHFNSNGYLVAIADDWDNSVSLVYTNVAGKIRLKRAEHSNGQFLDLGYTLDRVSRVDTPDPGFYLLYDYNAWGFLTNATRVSDSGSTRRSYEYSTPTNGLLSRRLNALGQAVDYSYTNLPSGESRGIRSVVAGSFLDMTMEHNTTGNYTTVTFDRGDSHQVYRYEYDPRNLRIVRTMGPDTNIVVTRMHHPWRLDVEYERVDDLRTGEWIETVRRHDGRRHLQSEAVGFGMPAADFWSYEWDPENDRLDTAVDPEGNLIDFGYTNGLLSSVGVFDPGSGYHATTLHRGTNGLVTSVENANGTRVRYAYDAYGFATSVVPEVGPVAFMKHSRLGHLREVSLPGDGGRRTTRFFSDQLGRVTNVVYPNGLSEAFFYDATGNLTNHVDTAGRLTTYAYAPMRRLASVSRINGDATNTIGFNYDKQFNTLKIVDAAGRAVEAYVFDAQDRPIIVTNVEGQAMTIQYRIGDFVDRVTRFDGSQVTYDYDDNGRLSKAIYPGATHNFSYFKNGLLKTLSSPSGTITRRYDGANRLTSETVNPSGGSASAVSYTYMPAGQVSNAVSVAGTNVYTYDAAERATGISASGDTFAYTYDDKNGLAASLALGSSGVTASYEYDVLDRITQLAWRDASNSVLRSFDYTYDNAGMITSITREGGERIDYAYDGLDRLVGETHLSPSDSVLSEEAYTYDAVGNRLRKAHGDMNALSRHGSSGNRVDGWSAGGTGTVAFVHLSGYSGVDSEDPWQQNEFTMGYEVAGSAPRPGCTVFYLDGNAHQSGPAGVSSAEGMTVPDPSGNPLHVTNAVVLGTVTNCTYGHDAAGCVTQIVFSGENYARTTDLEWNSLYQVTAASVNGSLAERYTYDGLGRLASISDGTTTRHMVYDGMHVVGEVDSAGALRKRYTYGPGIDNLLAMTLYGGETNTYYFLTDHLGSVSALVDADGRIVEQYRYDAWGRVTVYDDAGNPIMASQYNNRHLFQGREYSWSTGLYNFRARWYDPITGRWLSKDPIGISGGLNQYAFANNNPVNFRDPFGLYQTKTRNLFLLTLHHMNPFNMDGSLNSQFAAGWTLMMGDAELAGNLSGYGQLDEECAGEGWKRAYWGAVGLSAAAISVPAGQMLWQGGTAAYNLFTTPMGGFISAEYHAVNFAWNYPALARLAPFAYPALVAFVGGFSQAPPRMPGSWSELWWSQAGDAVFDTVSEM